MTINRLMSLIAMAFLWTGSQIPVYLFGGFHPRGDELMMAFVDGFKVASPR